MSARIINDKSVRHAMLAKLPAGQMRPLIARPRLIDPDMDRNAPIIRLIDGRERRSPVNGGQPAGVAMGEDIELALLSLRFPYATEDLQPVIADSAVDRDVLIADLRRLLIGRRYTLALRQRQEQLLHRADGPSEVDRRRSRRNQCLAHFPQGAVAGVRPEADTDAIGRRRPDQRRAAHQHRANRMGRLIQRFQFYHAEFMGQPRLVDNIDRPSIRRQPDAAIGLSIHFHVPLLRFRKRPHFIGKYLASTALNLQTRP